MITNIDPQKVTVCNGKIMELPVGNGPGMIEPQGGGEYVRFYTGQITELERNGEIVQCKTAKKISLQQGQSVVFVRKSSDQGNSWFGKAKCVADKTSFETVAKLQNTTATVEANGNGSKTNGHARLDQPATPTPNNIDKEAEKKKKEEAELLRLASTTSGQNHGKKPRFWESQRRARRFGPRPVFA